MCVCVCVCAGYAAGPMEDEGGSGSNFLCLPANPEWKTNGTTSDSPLYFKYGELVGVEYYVGMDVAFSKVNNNNNDLFGNLAPCVICHVTRRSSVLVIPAIIQCPANWTVEYRGFMVSSTSDDRQSSPVQPLDIKKRGSYLCWDDAPEAGPAYNGLQHALIVPVEVICGSLPCNVYPNRQEINCVVCSK